MTKARLLLLITRHLDGQLTSAEAVELGHWADLSAANRQFVDRVTNEEELEKEVQHWKNIDPADGYAKWLSNLDNRRKARVWRVMGWSAAASLLIIVTVIGLTRKHQQVPAVAVTTTPSVMPGKNTATLTLANGRQIFLDSVGKGELAVQGNTRLLKLDSGSLSYAVTGGEKEEKPVYNLLTTPRSGQYQVILPDGSHVWLNNVSSLRYPTVFRGKSRTVELTGEAYFEIAADPTRPFIVKVNGEELDVLGTSFNIMAYADEGTTQTTLLTGSVRVKAGSAAVQLQPDEQAQWNGSGSLTILKGVPSQDIVSWKAGFFYFGRASLKEVMRQLARWYDVEVKYEGAIPELEFGGKIDRSLPLNELLNFMNKNQVHFRLEGHTIVVLSS